MLMLIPKSSHSRRWSTVPPSSNSASNIREFLLFFSPSTYEQHLQQTFLQGKEKLTVSHMLSYLMCKYVDN